MVVSVDDIAKFAKLLAHVCGQKTCDLQIVSEPRPVSFNLFNDKMFQEVGELVVCDRTRIKLAVCINSAKKSAIDMSALFPEMNDA